MKARLKLGAIIIVILALVTACAAVAIATEFKSWRTANGNVIQRAGDDFLKRVHDKGGLMTSQDLYNRINDTDGVNGPDDPLVLDVRENTNPLVDEYGSGHIPGAIRIAPWYQIAEPENLDKLDEALACHIKKTGNDLIVVYCHTGHTAGFAASVLGSLGYNVKNLRFEYYVGWKAIMKKVNGIGINNKTMADYGTANPPIPGPDTTTVSSIYDCQ